MSDQWKNRPDDDTEEEEVVVTGGGGARLVRALAALAILALCAGFAGYPVPTTPQGKCEGVWLQPGQYQGPGGGGHVCMGFGGG